MKYKIVAIMLLWLFLARDAKAQGDVQFSDYTALKAYYNPAASGINGKMNVNAVYSMQMLGYEGAPATMYIGADMPIYFLSPRHGGGASFFNDKIGIFSTTKIGAQYAYNMKIGKEGKLAFGISGGLLTEKIDPSGMELEDNADPAFPSSQLDGNVVDLGAGLYYCHPKFWVGLSAMHLLGQTVEIGETNEMELSRVMYLMGGCNIKLKNSFISLQPSFMIQTDLMSWREDVQCKVVYEYEEKKFYGGLGYSPATSTTFMVGGMFNGVSLGYNYQMYTSGIGMLNGSHELVLSYSADLDLFKKGRNIHKSVRWL